jgi:hyperosmotically inducible periplasmic protein
MKRLILVVVLCLSMVSFAYAQGITSTLTDKATGLAKEKATEGATAVSEKAKEKATEKATAVAEKAKEKATAYTDDAGITTNVKLALADVAELKDAKIEVTTTKGVVTLKGTVKDAKAIKIAGKTAKGVEGVKSVKNKLTKEKPPKKVKKAKKAKE